MMRDRLGQQIVETSLVAALGGSIADLEQRLGLGPADRLMFDRGRGQDARAPSGVIGIERSRKVNAALGGGAFAGDHAIADDGQGMRGRLAARWLKGADGVDGLGTRGRHTYTSQFLVLVQHFHAGVNEWLTIRNSGLEIFRWLLISRCDCCHGSGYSNPAGRDAVHKRRYRGGERI